MLALFNCYFNLFSGGAKCNFFDFLESSRKEVLIMKYKKIGDIKSKGFFESKEEYKELLKKCELISFEAFSEKLPNGDYEVTKKLKLVEKGPNWKRKTYKQSLENEKILKWLIEHD